MDVVWEVNGWFASAWLIRGIIRGHEYVMMRSTGNHEGDVRW